MKLALVTHNIVKGDGQGRVNYEIARFAAARGAEVLLFADAIDHDLENDNCRWVRVRPRCRKPNLLKVREFVALADRALQRFAGQCDIVHACGFTTTRLHEVNTAHLVHGAWRKSPFHSSRVVRGIRGFYHWIYSALNAHWERIAFKRARWLVAPSDRVARELRDIGVPDEKISVIPNGVDLTEFKPGTADRRSLGLPVDVPLLLFAGDIRSPRKNLGAILAALPSLRGVHLAIAGALPGSAYPAQAEELAVTDRVHFLGYRRDLPALMRAADVFVFPSRYEPFSLVVLEAMASGLPVVTAKTVGASEVITPASGVVLEDSEDRVALVAAITGLVEGPNRRNEMGKAARAVAEQWSWRRMAQSYWELYQRVLAEPRRA